MLEPFSRTSEIEITMDEWVWVVTEAYKRFATSIQGSDFRTEHPLNSARAGVAGEFAAAKFAKREYGTVVTRFGDYTPIGGAGDIIINGGHYEVKAAVGTKWLNINAESHKRNLATQVWMRSYVPVVIKHIWARIALIGAAIPFHAVSKYPAADYYRRGPRAACHRIPVADLIGRENDW